MEYQTCPICNGNGQVSGGFYSHPGDYPYWTTDHTMETCQTCDGKGIIIKPSLKESNRYDCLYTGNGPLPGWV